MELQGEGGGKIHFEKTVGVKANAYINKYTIRGSYVDRITAIYNNDLEEDKEIRITFAVPKGKGFRDIEILCEHSEVTPNIEKLIEDSLPLSDDEEILGNTTGDFVFKTFVATVPAFAEEYDEDIGEVIQIAGREVFKAWIDSEAGEKNKMGVWVEGSFAGGSGTSGSPYQISNWTQLGLLRDYVVTADPEDVLNFELINDLDQNTTGYGTEVDNETGGWVPIAGNGLTTNGFPHIFDGRGFIIKGLKISDRTALGQGLFGVLQFGTPEVRNLGLEEIDIDVEAILSGGLCGYALPGLVEDCKASGSVKSLGGSLLVGVHRGIIRNCYSEGTVETYTTTAVYAGGITSNLVRFSTTGSSTLEKCWTSATVRGGTSTTTGVGGIVGFARYTTSVIDKNFALGSAVVRVSGTTTSGWHRILGRPMATSGTDKPTYTNNYANSAMTEPVEGAFDDKNADGLDGADITLANAKKVLSYSNNGWDIVKKGDWVDETWWIDEDQDYPRLWWEYPDDEPVLTGAAFLLLMV